MVFPAKYSSLNALELSDEARQILTRIIRVSFPHASFPDGPYERMSEKIIEASAESSWFRMALAQGLMTLDTLSDEHFLDLPDDRALAVLKRIADLEFFAFIRRTVVLNLYDDPEVQQALGYEGESFSKGGYLHRGFNDLRWLPEPRIEESAEPVPDLGPLPYTVQAYAPEAATAPVQNILGDSGIVQEGSTR
ncbi:hypothetical protein OF385_14990 [Glutamicibacter sp. JL.03c]|uniref:hypothetical protein n=1 Tax=Glutamicibacter sp. JL.03c TaxID=2984842 RepID=UPI0021F75D87|nr:hypothetical protein [Glutamicibacter sp. JL.03c]UYQ77308.1 hypothetical protein OF385_14990 [Glutamicibacter sp. JL.03c]